MIDVPRMEAESRLYCTYSDVLPTQRSLCHWLRRCWSVGYELSSLSATGRLSHLLRVHASVCPLLNVLTAS